MEGGGADDFKGYLLQKGTDVRKLCSEIVMGLFSVFQFIYSNSEDCLNVKHENN